MITLKDDQKKMIDYLESKRQKDAPIENASIGVIAALIQLGMLDIILSGQSIDDFSNVVIYRVMEYMKELMKDEKIQELMDNAFNNAIEEA